MEHHTLDLENEDNLKLSGEINQTLIGRGPCRDEPLSDTGKRIQLVKMLCLTVLPILGLWGFTVYTLTDTINKKTGNEQTKKELQMSVELGQLIHHLQQERDMSLLYLSALGPETKTFLLTEYIETNKAIYALSDWPSNLDNKNRDIFESKDKLQEYLSRHRQLLRKDQYNLNAELDFYTNIIDVVIIWLYKSITQGQFAVVWKTLVAYLKLTSGKQDVGIERALGTLFYVQGGFHSRDYETYNNRINRFKAFYTTAELYSNRVDRLYTSNVRGVDTNITGIINNFRYEIQHVAGTVMEPDIQKARYWFDNMTLYLDTLLNIQRDLGYEIIDKLDVVIDESTRDLSISAAFLVIVLIMCPLVIFATENLTSSIQKYAFTLVNKTNELSEEKKKTDLLLYQMVPMPLAEKLKQNLEIDAEYFQSVTIFFSDIFGFGKMSVEYTPMDIVQLLNTLYKTMDDLLDDYDVYKVETINDCYMVASGLPTRNGNNHVSEISNLALDLLSLMQSKQFSMSANKEVKLRIGINTGTCMAGTIGTILPRYCLFGDTVNTASRMKSHGDANRIHISPSTNNALKKFPDYVTKLRGNLKIKGKGEMKTYWLLGKQSEGCQLFPENEVKESEEHILDYLPGEVSHFYNHNVPLILRYTYPGQSASGIPKKETSVVSSKGFKATARVLPTTSSLDTQHVRSQNITNKTTDESPNETSN